MSKKYIMVVRNFDHGTLKFPVCDVSRQEIDDFFTIHLRDLVHGEVPFFMQSGSDTVFLEGSGSAAHGFWYLTAYAYIEGADEVDLKGRPEFAYCAWKRKPDDRDWVVWSSNDCSALCSLDEADSVMLPKCSDHELVYTKRLAEMACRGMLTMRMIRTDREQHHEAS